MMGITKVPARGQAWSGDWRARVFERLRARGLESVTAFADSRPAASAVELADEPSIDATAGIDRADVAAEQLLRIWREEARGGGSEATERLRRPWRAALWRTAATLRNSTPKSRAIPDDDRRTADRGTSVPGRAGPRRIRPDETGRVGVATPENRCKAAKPKVGSTGPHGVRPLISTSN
jgi:hypothetical protein